MSVIRGLIVTLCVIVIAIISLVILAVDSAPTVSTQAARQVDHADSVHALLEDVQLMLEERNSSHQLRLSAPQIESLVGFLQRATAQFRGNATISSDNLQFAASMTLPVWSEKYWLNIDLTLLPGDRINLDHVTIGSITLPGNSALWLAEKAVNIWTASDIASEAIAQVSNVRMAQHHVTLDIAPLAPFLHRLNEVKYGLNVEQDTELRDLTAYYLRYAAGQPFALADSPQPLVDYIRVTLARAREQSKTPEQAVRHNEAAILALAIFIGHHRIANFVGDVQPDADRALKPASPAWLRERDDLAKHFIISAALKLLSEQGVSLAIGEFKELMDRAMGGSGYSFVDLTADMAGLAFADVATHASTAKEAQDMLVAARSDDVIMPSIDGLPEGLSKRAFEAQFGGVDSEAYLAMVEEIKSRLRQVPLYSLNPDAVSVETD